VARERAGARAGAAAGKDLHARVLHEWVPEAIRELLREAGVRNAAVYHLKDDIQAPEYVAEGVAELGGREIPVTIHLDVLVDYKVGEATLLYARLALASRPTASYPTTTLCRTR